MKKIYLATVLALAFICFSLDASAFSGLNFKHRRGGRHHHHNVVGAPLDGGLLAILGAAGIAYYVARKKKVTKE